MKAPHFSLPDQNNIIHHLSGYREKWVVLYFYPKDDTPGCTKEACSFRDYLDLLHKEHVIVLSVSKDSPSSHKKFAEKYRLNFPLLSDETAHIIKAYGAWGKKKFMGREYEGILRTTFLINPQGIIVKEYKNVDPTDHAQKIYEDIKKLNKRV